MSKLKIAIHLTGINVQLVKESKTSHEHNTDQMSHLNIEQHLYCFHLKKKIFNFTGRMY